MTTQEQSQIWGNFWQIMEVSKNYLSDYEKLLEKKELLRELPQAESAYIDAIIIHISKIFSDSKNEPFRLGRFKEICRDEIKEELNKVENEHKDIIKKMITNRNKLIAHLDKKFYELCFSEKEKERMTQDWEGRSDLKEASYIFASMPKATDKSQERYSARDFQDDLPAIKKMLKELSDIWNRSIPFAPATSK